MMSKEEMVVSLCAGEASGDRLGAECIEAIRGWRPRARFYGVGGAQMRACGMEVVADYEALAVMGYWRAAAQMPAILRARRKLLRRMAADAPDLFIGIDAPDFNLRIAPYARRAAQYVAPSVWMWRRRRMGAIRRAVDSVWCLLPFEAEVYRRAGMAAEYVGHPAARAEYPARAAARRRLGVAAEAEVIALLPGSRGGELAQHLSLFGEAARRLAAAGAGRRFVAAAHSAAAAGRMRAALPGVVVGELADVLAAADAAVVKSGTVALEAAMAGLPFVMVYQMSAAAYALVRFKRFYLPFFCLPNILARRFVVPELIQDAATAESIVGEVARLLQDGAARDKMRRDFAEIKRMLTANTTSISEAADKLLSQAM